MKLEILNCRGCGLTFGVDEKAIGDDELVTCPLSLNAYSHMRWL